MQYYTTDTATNKSKRFLQMASENQIHPTAIIGNNVRIGKGNKIGAYVVIQGKTFIENNNVFESFSCVGNEPQPKDFLGKKNKGTYIGNNNVFREYVTINAGFYVPTILGDNITIFRGSHIGHDTHIHDNCIIGCNVLIEGNSLLGIGVNIELGSICEKHSKIGSYALICASTLIPKKSNLNCFGAYSGNPAKYIKENDFIKLKWSYEMVLDTCAEFDKMVDGYDGRI
jgi:UDP-N-acetylglucosamine acyltransferase